MSEKKLSIIIPIYNMEKYLDDCLDSVVNQTLKDIEIILINDGSTDDSAAIIKRYKQLYNDMILVIDKENGGQGAARNLGIEAASGKYIGFVDADDSIEADMYETMYEVAHKSDADFVECDYRFLMAQDGKEVELDKYGDVRKREGFKELFLNPLVSPWNKIYRSSILKDNSIKFPEGLIYEDTSFYLKVIPYIRKMEFVDKTFVKHYLRSNSTMTGSRSSKVADIFMVMEDALDFYNSKGFFDKYRSELEYFWVKILLCSSMERIAKISEKDIRKADVDRTWDYIRRYFPNYKKNKYLKGGMKNLYIRISKPFISSAFVFVMNKKH